MTDKIWNTFNEELLGFIQSRVHDRHAARDILQNVFEKVHRKLDTLKDQSRLTPWIYQITRNSIIDYYRTNKTDHYPDGDRPINTLDAPQPEPDLDFTKCLKPFINQLEKKDRDVLDKITYRNMSQKQYAEENNLTYTATKSRVQRARKKLKQLFLDCCAIKADTYGNIIEAIPQSCTC